MTRDDREYSRRLRRLEEQIGPRSERELYAEITRLRPGSLPRPVVAAIASARLRW